MAEPLRPFALAAQRLWRRLARVAPWRVLLCAWLVVLVYAWPGYMNWDSGDQLNQARIDIYGDWYPPMLAFYWRPLDMIVRGPLGLLLVQTPLFLWGLYTVLRRRLAPSAAAWCAAALVLFPPILTPLAPVWKDAQMAGFLLGGFACTLSPRWRVRAIGLVLLFVASGVRTNAPAATPALLLVAVASWGVRGRVRTVAVAFGVFVAVTGASRVANSLLTDLPLHVWDHTLGPWDIQGTLCHAESMSDAELRAQLDGIGHIDADDTRRAMCAGYTPRVSYWPADAGPNFFVDPAEPAQRNARSALFARLVREHPRAYLEHRAAVMAELLGVTSSPPWEPVCQTNAVNADFHERLRHDASLSWIQRELGALFLALSRTPLYRPWIYALLALVLLGRAAWTRDGLVAALCGSGLLYEASYFFGAPEADFRYSHWMIACTAMAAVLTIARRRAA